MFPTHLMQAASERKHEFGQRNYLNQDNPLMSAEADRHLNLALLEDGRIILNSRLEVWIVYQRREGISVPW